MGKLLKVKVFCGSKAGQCSEIYVGGKKKDIRKQLSEEELAEAKKGCDGKVKHKSMLSANEYLYNSKENLEIYECRFCGNYHLGHPKRKEEL